jgi:hypothetical protein
MLKPIFLFFLFFVSFVAFSQKQSHDVLQLKETQFNFGKIPQGKPVTHSFIIVNTGDSALLLENVQASCGCTTPEWSKSPILPGAESIIKVGYNAASEGAFEKSINIFHNKGLIKTIVIKGEVSKTPEKPAPLNSSLIFLNKIN